MDWSPSRRDVLRAVATGITAAVAGCSFYNPKADVDTPDPNPTATTPTPRPMDPIDATHGPEWNEAATIERTVFERVNEARRTRDLEEYARDVELAYMAKAHCQDMAQRDYFAHESPDGEGVNDRMRAYGLDSTYFSVTENLVKFHINDDATKASVAERMIQLWKESDPHWETITGTINDRAGVGVYITEERTLYGAIVFGKLRDPEP